MPERKFIHRLHHVEICQHMQLSNLRSDHGAWLSQIYDEWEMRTAPTLGKY